MTMLRPAAAILTAAALGACTAAGPSAERPAARYASLDAIAAPPAAAPAAATRAGTPVAAMPDWIGRPLRVRERSDAGGFEQAVFLSLSARGDERGNIVLVSTGRMAGAGLDAVADGAGGAGRVSPMAAPTEAGIRAEIEAAFPGIAMTVVTRPASNAYGPYGLAVGRTARGARCLYAWQWIDDIRAKARAQAGHQGETWPEGPLSLRVRMCRDDITLEAMAAAVNQVRLSPPGTAAPTPVPAVATARPEPRAARRREVRPAHRPERAAERATRRVAAAEPAAPAPERRVYAVPRTAEPLAAAGGLPGRRYLGADAPRERPAAYAATTDAPLARAGGLGTVPAASALAADLPAEAYRGPAGR